MNYQLTVNQQQACIIRSALDFYSRVLGIGQVEEVEWHLRAHMPMDDDFEFKSRLIRDACDSIKSVAFGYEPNQSGGIRSPDVPAEYRIAYDMIQRLRKVMSDVRIAELKAEGNEDMVRHIRITVDQDDYWPTYPDCPAMDVETTE